MGMGSNGRQFREDVHDRKNWEKKGPEEEEPAGKIYLYQQVP